MTANPYWPGKLRDAWQCAYEGDRTICLHYRKCECGKTLFPLDDETTLIAVYYEGWWARIMDRRYRKNAAPGSPPKDGT